MPRRTARIAAALAACPICGSSAVSCTRIEEGDAAQARCLLRCGACEIWRGAELDRRVARALSRRWADARMRERRRLRRDLRRLERLEVGL